MSFLKDLKSDLSQAVNEMITDEELVLENGEVVNDEEMIDTLSEELTIEDTEINTLDEEVDTLDEEVNTLDEEVVAKATEENDVMEIKETMTETNYETNNAIADDEVTEITLGTTITGNIETTGSINVYGKVVGDIKCRGKLSVTGSVVGTSQASEIFANNAKIEGNVISDGSVKIGNGSVIIGNVTANSAVIGGAVKGDIDVHGPVIVDATAVVQGNIKSRSVQINNGAAIEGFCSQCYAEIDYKSLFDDTFSK